MVAVVTPASLRAARALLGWSMRDLVRESGVGLSTINAIENGQRERAAYPSTQAKLIATFRAHGVEVLGPPRDGARRLGEE